MEFGSEPKILGFCEEQGSRTSPLFEKGKFDLKKSTFLFEKHVSLKGNCDTNRWALKIPIFEPSLQTPPPCSQSEKLEDQNTQEEKPFRQLMKHRSGYSVKLKDGRAPWSNCCTTEPVFIPKSYMSVCESVPAPWNFSGNGEGQEMTLVPTLIADRFRS